ncbi:MAG TPA: hypothetical protein VGI14_15265, partial [Casimicrobiaceae bacterium]
MRTLIAAAVVAPLLGSGIALAQSGGTQPGRYAVDVEALAWWFKSSPTPTPIITDGVFGKPGTHVLLGGGDMDTNPNAGLRLTAGHALNVRWGARGQLPVLRFALDAQRRLFVRRSGIHRSPPALLR